MPQQIGKFEVSDKIGEGGFGTIYRGLDPVIKRPVAIKTCNTEDPETRSRFTREAQIAGNLHHRHIVTIYDFGVQDDVPYLVQEYLSGEDLDHKIKRGDDIDLEDKVLYLLQIARGLQYAHEHGVIHRDIKPANIRVLEDGTAKILDFGIAKLANQQTVLTQTGMTLGTAAYLAPEQIQDTPVDHRTDIFSFGVLAFELLTYQRPFPGDTMSHVLYRILHEQPPSLTELAPGCPPQLIELVERCLAKDPDDRYPNCGRIESVLARILHELRGGTQPVPKPSEDDTADIVLDPEPPPEPTRRSPALGDFDLHGAGRGAQAPMSYGSGTPHRQRGFSWGRWVVGIALVVGAALGLQVLHQNGTLDRLVAAVTGETGSTDAAEPLGEETSDPSQEAAEDETADSTPPPAAASTPERPPTAEPEVAEAAVTETAPETVSEPVVEEPPPPPPPPPPEPATLVLPRAWSGSIMVTVDGETYRMDGDRRLELDAGTYSLRFTYRSGDYSDTRSRTVELGEGETKTVGAPIPRPGRLTIQKGLRSPVGRIVLDGDAVGSLVRQQIARPGSHELRVEREAGGGEPIVASIDVPPGQHLVVTFDLSDGSITSRVRDD